MTRRRLTIVQAALGGVLLASGLDGHGWVEIILGGATVLLAVVDGGAESKPRPPAKSNTERVLAIKGRSRGGGVVVLFHGPAKYGVIAVPYEESPLNMFEEIHRLPGFDIEDTMRLIDSIKPDRRITCWERASPA